MMSFLLVQVSGLLLIFLPEDETDFFWGFGLCFPTLRTWKCCEFQAWIQCEFGVRIHTLSVIRIISQTRNEFEHQICTEFKPEIHETLMAQRGEWEFVDSWTLWSILGAVLIKFLVLNRTQNGSNFENSPKIDP
jgi:hypothetical protein